ncbi:MAG: hypothetical protein GF350_15915 [Chitinivibrionales bacterium]|nr:hypothetical protein [Chitinivibrionales bacterium]
MRSFISLTYMLMAFACFDLFADYTCYVSTNGDDNREGTFDQPFQTIQKARDVLRTKSGNKIVYLRGGTYRVTGPIVLEAQDGGGSGSTVIYQAYENEEPLISGGREISGSWEQHEQLGNGTVWRVHIPDVQSGNWYFRELFVDGSRSTRARFPNNRRYHHVVDGNSQNRRAYFGEMVAPWLDTTATITHPELLTDAMVEVPEYSGWNMGIFNKVINSATQLEADPPIVDWAENSLAFLDIPNEWYLDKTIGYLYYMFPGGENPAGRNFIAPYASMLLDIQGISGGKVLNLTFKGIHFSHSAFDPLNDVPESKGYDQQWVANYNRHQDGTNGVLTQVPVAILGEYSENLRFELCRIRQMGGCAIGFGRGVVRSGMVGCEVGDIANTGIVLGWRGRTGTGLYDRSHMYDLGSAWGGSDNIPRDNYITDCHVHHCGMVFECNAGIYAPFQHNFDISYNRIHNVQYNAIVVQHFTGDSRSKCTVYNNHINDCMGFFDGGLIYSSVTQTGAEYKGNFFERYYRRSSNGAATYLDDYSENFLIENNVAAGKLKSRVKESQTHTFTNNNIAPTEQDIAAARASTGPREPYRTALGIDILAYPPRNFGLDKTGWSITCPDHRSGAIPENAIDNNWNTLWQAVVAYAGYEVVIDMGKTETFNNIAIEAPEFKSPAYISVSVSQDGADWGQPVFYRDSSTLNCGWRGLTLAWFAPQQARYIKLVKTEEHGDFMADDITVFNTQEENLPTISVAHDPGAVVPADDSYPIMLKGREIILKGSGLASGPKTMLLLTGMSGRVVHIAPCTNRILLPEELSRGCYVMMITDGNRYYHKKILKP